MNIKDNIKIISNIDDTQRGRRHLLLTADAKFPQVRLCARATGQERDETRKE